AAVGPFVAAALAVLRAAKRVTTGGGVSIGDGLGAAQSVVLPPADPALLGQVNRALSARGVRWHFGAPGPPGTIASADLPMVRGVQVNRRDRLEGTEGDSGVVATVSGEPWLVRDGGVVLVGSRLDTTWTALPAAPGFVPFVDALANRIAKGEALVERLPPSGMRLAVSGLPGSAPAVLVGALARQLPQRVFVCVAPTATDAERWLADVATLVGETAALYPQREALGAEEAHFEIAGERIETLEALLRARVRILVTTARATAE